MTKPLVAAKHVFCGVSYRMARVTALGRNRNWTDSDLATLFGFSEPLMDADGGVVSLRAVKPETGSHHELYDGLFVAKGVDRIHLSRTIGRKETKDDANNQ